MSEALRRSPVDFGIAPDGSEERNGWLVALGYGVSGEGPRLIDLCHVSKWDLQDSNLEGYRPFGLSIPDKYGRCAYENGIIVNRMNRTQCAVWHLGGGYPEPPAESAYTETTDGLAMLAVCGPGALDVMEAVTSLDFADPKLEPPCLIQGPILHIPCQAVLLKRDVGGATVVFTLSRGYGQAMAEAILHSGSGAGLKPGGVNDLAL